jgi:hypothetical protein
VLLPQESEYAAWVLLHGYAANHIAIAVHRIPGMGGGLRELNKLLLSQGFQLNEAGGAIKASPDGLLLQSSTVADIVPYEMADGTVHQVCSMRWTLRCSYQSAPCCVHPSRPPGCALRQQMPHAQHILMHGTLPLEWWRPLTHCAYISYALGAGAGGLH